MLPSTTTRVPQHTSDTANEAIWQRTIHNVQLYENATPRQIKHRLNELDREWDIERTLEANAAAVSMLGVGLATQVDRKWWLLPGIVGTFLLQHAVQGWCPPMVWFRRMGIRTQAEIQIERDALRALRGDFDGLPVRNGNRPDAEATLVELRQRRDGEAQQ